VGGRVASASAEMTDERKCDLAFHRIQVTGIGLSGCGGPTER
jgi:hypothetical protein